MPVTARLIRRETLRGQFQQSEVPAGRRTNRSIVD